MTQNLWNNVISVRFQLLDQTCETKPDDLILNLPFCTYLPLHTIEISQHFFTHEIESPLWFSCDQKLLDWNLPLGVLFDIFQCSRHQTSDSFSDPYSRPWTVEVNISAFPSRQLMHLFSFDAMASSFNQQIKEALQLTSHSAQIYQRASPTTKIELFTAVSTASFSSYNNVIKSIIPNFTQSIHPLFDADLQSPLTEPRRYPFRFYFEANEMRYLQPPLPYASDSQTIFSILLQLFPKNESLHEDQAFTFSEHEDLNPVVLIHSISIPLDTPANWIAENLRFPDQFVYFVICKTKKRKQQLHIHVRGFDEIT